MDGTSLVYGSGFAPEFSALVAWLRDRDRVRVRVRDRVRVRVRVWCTYRV